MSHTPHDALFKSVFSHPPRAMDELRTMFPPQVVRALDLASAHLVSGSFVDEALKERQADLLFRLRLTGQEALAYLLFEHQSTTDPLLPFRVLRYLVRIWERWLAENPGATRLPVVLPLILTHAPGGWTAPRRLSEILDAPAPALRALAPWLPDFLLRIDDLWNQPDATLRGRSMDALARLTVLSLKHSREDEDLEALVREWGDLIREVLDSPRGDFAFRRLLQYLVRVRKVDGNALGAALEDAAGPRAKEALMTTADELIAEGMRKGLQQGMQQGMQQGSQEGLERGLRRVLLLQVGLRFGPPSPEVEGRIHAASSAELERWLARIMSAPSLAEVFAD